MRKQQMLDAVVLLALTAVVLGASGRGAPKGKAALAKEYAEETAPAVTVLDVSLDELPESGLPAREMLPALDADAVAAAMPEADRAAFAGYLAVLRGEAAFRWVAGPYDGYESDWEPFDATLADFHDQLWDGFAIEDPPETLTLDRQAVQDVDGDGEAELVLLFQDGAYQYLILSREGETVYGTSMGVRWFEELQTSGVYVGSGGAFDHTYYRMTFQNGRFEDRELARRIEGIDSAAYTLDGKEAFEAEFNAWYAENMVGGVTWYAPDGTASQDAM